jgi:hypothetical protein
MIKLIFTEDEMFSKNEFTKVLHAEEAYSCIDEINRMFRDPFKHGTFNGKELTEEQIEFFDKIYEKVKEIIEDLPARY